MDKRDFRARLKALGWTQAEFGRRLGLSGNSISRWVEIPKYAEVCLDLYTENLRMKEALKAFLEK